MNAYTQPTIWEVPDDVWTLIEPVLKEVYPAKPTGPRRVELRRVLNGMICRLRTGCQWNQLPQPFGDDSTVHRHCQRWGDLGVFERIWAVRVQACEALGGVDWPWQAADAAMGNARMGGDLVGRHPTDRGQKGESATAWWKPMAGHWGSPLPPPTCTTPSCSRRRSRPSWTYRREAAITPHLLYLLVTKGVTRALPNVCDGRKHGANGPAICQPRSFLRSVGSNEVLSQLPSRRSK